MSDADLLARFDAKLKLYLVLQVAAVLAFTGVGLVVLPFWVFAGPVWAHFYFPTIQARLSHRALLYSHGVLFRQEMSIPLDKIQDVSLLHGPLLDAFGLCTLKVETAGGGQTGSAAVLVGVMQAAEFRSAVIARRDAIAGQGTATADSELQLLREIRDSLLRIEDGMRREGHGGVTPER